MPPSFHQAVSTWLGSIRTTMAAMFFQRLLHWELTGLPANGMTRNFVSIQATLRIWGSLKWTWQTWFSRKRTTGPTIQKEFSNSCRKQVMSLTQVWMSMSLAISQTVQACHHLLLWNSWLVSSQRNFLPWSWIVWIWWKSARRLKMNLSGSTLVSWTNLPSVWGQIKGPSIWIPIL